MTWDHPEERTAHAKGSPEAAAVFAGYIDVLTKQLREEREASDRRAQRDDEANPPNERKWRGIRGPGSPHAATSYGESLL